MNPIKRKILNVIDSNIGFVEGMEVDPIQNDELEIHFSLHGTEIGVINASDLPKDEVELETYLLSQPFIKALKK